MVSIATSEFRLYKNKSASLINVSAKFYFLDSSVISERRQTNTDVVEEEYIKGYGNTEIRIMGPLQQSDCETFLQITGFQIFYLILKIWVIKTIFVI